MRKSNSTWQPPSVRSLPLKFVVFATIMGVTACNCCHKLMLHLVLNWEAFVAISIIPSAFLVSYQVIYNASSVVWQLAIIYAVDVIFASSIVIRLFQSYTTRRGEVIKDWRKTTLHYLSTYFILDTITVIPFELLVIHEVFRDKPFSMAIFRMNRYIRIFRVWFYLYHQEKKLDTNTTLFMSLRYILLGATSVHSLATFWYAVACNNIIFLDKGEQLCAPGSWAQHHDVDGTNMTNFQRYFITLYWSVTTMTTVGYGDITPKTIQEKWVAIISMIWGVLIFGYILGGITAVLKNSDSPRTLYIHHMNAVKQILIDARASHSLKAKVLGYYQYMWKRNHGRNGRELISKLPQVFQEEITLENYRRVLEKSTLFRDSSEDVLSKISLVVKHVIYVPKQVIISRGAFNHNVYVIQSGETEMVADTHPRLVTVLKKEEVFGDICLVSNNPSPAMMRARTYCELLVLSKEDLTRILHDFPEMAVNLRQKIKRWNSEVVLQMHTATSDTSDDEVESSFLVVQKSKFHLRKSNFLKRVWRLVSRPLMPGSDFIITWNVSILIVIIMVCWIYPYQAAFTHLKPWLGYTGSIAGYLLLTFTYFLDSILVMDIFISMKSITITSTEIVSKPKALLLRYITSVWFLLDVLAVLPLEMFSFIWHHSGNEWKYFPILRLNRLLKFWKVIAFFQELEGSLHFPITYANLLKFTVYTLTTTHAAACLWFPIACFHKTSCLMSSWAHLHGITSLTSPWHDYLASFYWSIATTTTVGYGDISARNMPEMIISVIVQLVGVMMYGYTLGLVAATLSNVASPRVSFMGKLQTIHKFMSKQKGKSFVKRVNSYFKLPWKQYWGEVIPGEGLMDDLPQSIQEEVCMKRCGSLLNKVHLFNGTSLEEFRKLSTVASIQCFSPGDIILYGGDMGRELYCVRKGHVEILSEDLSHVVAVQHVGSYFGTSGFLMGGATMHTVRAADYCELVMLKREDVDRIPNLQSKLKAACRDARKQQLACDFCEEGILSPRQKSRTVPDYSVVAGLAASLATPLSVILRSSVRTTIVACIDDLDAQKKVLGPINTCGGHTGLVARYTPQELRNRKPEEKAGEGLKISSLGHGLESKEVNQKEDAKMEMYYRSRFLRSTGLQNIFPFCVLPCSILPNTVLSYWWERLTFLLVIVFAMIISLQAAFLHTNLALWIITYLLDFYFIADMVMSMHACFFNANGVLVTYPTACAEHYFKSTFWIDFVSSFPLDLIVVIAWTKLGGIARVLSLTRINRLLKLYKLTSMFDALEERFANSIGFIKIMKFTIYLSLGAHLAACGWFLLACSSLVIGPYNPHVCAVDSWAFHYSHSPLSTFSVFHQYTVSLYWAIATTTTVGYGDIRAHTDMERAYSCVIMVYGVVSYGYVIASVAASMVNDDASRGHYQDRLNAVKTYLKEQNIKEPLLKRVIRYYKHMWKKNSGVCFDNLFEGLPLAMQADISLSLYKPIIDQVPLFKNTGLGFSKLLALGFKPVTYPRKEYIIREGDTGNEMFIITNGSVEVVSKDGEMVFTTLNKGQFFGETSLVCDFPHSASIRAATNTDLLVLTKVELDHVFSSYPYIAEEIRRLARKRFDLVKKINEKLGKESVHSKNPKTSRKTGYKKPFCCRPENLWFPIKLCTFTIPHNKMFGILFYWIGCFLSYFSFFSYSYQGIFQDSNSVLLWMNYSFEFYFLLEVFLKFHTTYRDKGGNVIKDLKRIAVHYVADRRGFVMDFIALLPYETLALLVKDASLRQSLQLYFKLPHLVRVVRINWLFTAEQKNLNQRTVLLQLIKCFVLFSLWTQAVSCIWYLLACHLGTCHQDTWTSTVSGLPWESSTRGDHYGNSLYWAVVTMTTVGYGDIPATNQVEMLYAMAVMVLGKLLFAYILGLVASTVINLDMRRMLFKEKLTALKKYVGQLNLSSSTRQRVLDFSESLWSRSEGENRSDILADLPYCLQAEVSQAIAGGMLRNVDLFSDADEAFLRHMAVIMKPRFYPPGEFIVHKGEMDFGMFFLCQGEVEVVQQNGYRTKLHEESSFGIKSLLYSIPADSALQAVTHSDMLTFSKSDFQEVLRKHPKTQAKIRKLAQARHGLPVHL